MKTDHPYFMASVEVASAEASIRSALQYLEDKQAGLAIISLTDAIQKASSAIILVHEQSIRQTRKESRHVSDDEASS